MKPDIDGAKKLLADAGYADGHRAQHRLRQHQRALAAAGLRDPAGPARRRPGSSSTSTSCRRRKYWEIWDQTPFGVTAWTHRPLGTMVLSVGYRTGVPWNESRLRQQGVRRRPGRGRGAWSTSSSAGRPWRRSRRSSRMRRSWCSRCGSRSSSSRRKKVQGMKAASDAVPPVPSRLADAPDPSDAGRGPARAAGPTAGDPPEAARPACCCSLRAASPRWC